ncbi:MAG: hypothetical protein ACYS4W_11780 [Planctomycetota bacterium]|jgi:hypothetical protein
MAGQEDDNKPERIRPGRKWLLRALVFPAAALVVLVFLSMSGRWGIRSAEEKLAAIDAARAIPDQENAAVIYTQLAESTDLASGQPEFFGTEGKTGPWLSADHPEAAGWLERHQGEIAGLLEACQRQKCHFPLPAVPAEWQRYVKRLTDARHWAFLLVSAANNDVAEGRIDAGLQKYLCTIKLAGHIRRQPLIIDFLVGTAVDALALEYMKGLIVEGDVTGAHLEIIEQGLPSTTDSWDKIWPQLLEMDRLYQRLDIEGQYDQLLWKNVGFFRRLKLIFLSKRTSARTLHKLYLRTLVTGRGTRILVALRRYKNKHGFWPESLDQIKGLVPPEATIDPTNNGPFTYKLTGNEFKLYSKGKNKIDEDGRFRDEADDWPIWPREADLRQRRR